MCGMSSPTKPQPGRKITTCDVCRRPVVKLQGLSLGGGSFYLEVDPRTNKTTGPHTCSKGTSSVFVISAGAVNSNRRRH
jgi:hypothetical protein